MLRRVLVEKPDRMLHSKMGYWGMTEFSIVTRIFGVASPRRFDPLFGGVGVLTGSPRRSRFWSERKRHSRVTEDESHSTIWGLVRGISYLLGRKLLIELYFWLPPRKPFMLIPHSLFVKGAVIPLLVPLRASG